MSSFSSFGAGVLSGSGQARLTATLALNDQMSRGLTLAQRNISGFEQYMSNRFGPGITEAVNGIGHSLLATGKAAVAFGGALTVVGRSVARFDKEIAGIAAVMGETGKEAVAPIRQQAIELSRQFAFTAQEVAEGQLFIAQAGGKLNDVLVATPEILNLATATMENFDLAAKLTIKTLNAFGNQISEISEVRKVVNDLQYAVNNSVSTLQTLNDSLKFAAPFAHVLGIELEDLLSVFILTSNAGIEAGIAGRSLAQGLQQLVRSGMRGASESAQAFAHDLSNVISAGGSLADVVEEVETRFGVLNGAEVEQLKALNEMSDAEIEAAEAGNSLLTVTGRLSELVQVFGVRGARVFGLLLGQSGKLREFRAAMELQVISAADQARVAMDNLADQVQISLNKIQAGILESDFGKVLGEKFKELNDSGDLDKLGAELGDVFTELADRLLPVLIDSLETLVSLMQSAGPGLIAAFETVGGVLKIVNNILQLIPEGIRTVLVSALVLNKALGLTPIIMRRFGLSVKQAALDGVSSFATLGFQIKKLEIEQKLARSEVINFGIQHKISGAIVRQELRAIDAQYAALIARQRQAAAASKGLAIGGKVLGVAGAGLALASSLTQDEREMSGGEIATDALGTGLAVGAAVSMFATPVVGAAAGIGAALLVGVTDYFKSEAAKKKAQEAQNHLEDLLASDEFKKRLENLGSDIGSQMSAAIEIGIRMGTSDLATTVEDILHNPKFQEASRLVALSGGRLSFDPGLKSGTVLSDAGKGTDVGTGKFSGGGGMNFLGVVDLPFGGGGGSEITERGFDNERLREVLKSIGSPNVDTAEELQAALPKLADKIIKLAAVEQKKVNEEKASIDSRAMDAARASVSKENALQTDETKKIKETGDDGKLTEEFRHFFEREQARISGEEGFAFRPPAEIISGVTQSLLAGTGLENLGQIIQGGILGKGFAATDFKVEEVNGVFQVKATFQDINKSFLDELVKKSKDGITDFGIEKHDDQSIRATTFKLAEETVNLGVQIATYQTAVKASADALMKVNQKLAELERSLSESKLSITKNKVSGSSSLADFLAKNGESLGFNNKEVAKAQENLIKVHALQEIIGLKEFQFQQKDLEIQQAMKQNEYNLALGEQEVARRQLRTDLDTLETKLLLRDTYETIIEALLAANTDILSEEQASTIKSQLEALQHIRDQYDDVINSNDDIKALLDKIGVEEEKIRKFVIQQKDNYEDMNKFIEDLAASLGVNLNALSQVERQTFFAWAQALVAAALAEQMNKKISTMLSGADALGKALEESRQRFVELGYSASAVDDAIKQFKRVEFLNSMLGFLNNFEELAVSTGSNLNLSETIMSIKKRLLNAGDDFLHDLLDITDPETFADILSRQNFVEQNVSKVTTVNLQAELIFPEGITSDQREDIAQIALSAVAEAVNRNPLLGG